MNRTERDISDAFWELLGEKPYSRITVKDIVDRCQVHRNTFYYHFQDIPALAEFSIQNWADDMIRKNFKFGSPLSCFTPMIRECEAQKKAILNVYRSVHQDRFIHYMNKIIDHIVSMYFENAADGIRINSEDAATLSRFYRCTLAGVTWDWLDSGMEYDLLSFAERICTLFDGSGINAIMKCSAGNADNTDDKK